MEKLNWMELSSWLGFELRYECEMCGSFNQVLMNLALIPCEFL